METHVRSLGGSGKSRRSRGTRSSASRTYCARNRARCIESHNLGTKRCEVAVSDIHAADELKAALAGRSEVPVVCPMNPRAEHAAAEHQSMIGAFGRALEHVKPRSVLAISDYGACHIIV